MNGIVKRAMTIISQSLCLRSAFIITDENCSGGEAQSQICEKIPQPKLQYPSKSQTPKLKPFAPYLFGISLIGICLGFASWDLGFCSNGICSFSDDLPCLAQMFFRREHITKANSHHRSAAQFCLRQISASGSIDSLHNLAVQLIDGYGAASRRSLSARRRRRVSNKSKTNHTHADGRSQLEAVIGVNPAHEQVCHAHLFA